MWRVTAVGLIALPAVAWLLPALQIHVPPFLSANDKEAVETLPSPFGRGAGGEGFAGREGSTIIARSLEVSPVSHSDQAFVASRGTGNGAGNERRAKEHNALTPTLSQREKGLLSWPPLTATTAETIVLFVWLGGIAVLAFRLSIGHYRIWRMVRCAKSPPEWICGGCARVAERIGCPRGVELLQSADARSPFLCGLRRPRLLLPARMCDDSYCRDLPGILAHELTHVRCHDVLWNAGLQLISIVLWFHPLVWRMRKAHLAACELVCDAASASFVGDVADYCRTLARVAVDAYRSLPAAGIAMARTPAISRRLGALKERVFHLPLRRRRVVGVGFAALLAVAVVGTLQFATAELPATEPGAVADKEKAKPAPNDEHLANNIEAAAKDGFVRITKSSVRPRAMTVGGTVTTPDGTPSADATVGIYVTEFPGSNFPRTRTDGNGHYRFTVDEPREYIVAADAEGFVPGWKRITVEKDRLTADLQLVNGKPVRVRVIDHKGKPMPGVRVGFTISLSDKNAGLIFLDYEREPKLWLKRTDVDGRWSTNWIPDDKIRLNIEREGYLRSSPTLAPGEGEKVIMLEPGICVSGRVVDQETGAPIKKFRVTDGWQSNPHDGMIWYRTRSVENENGEYRIFFDTLEDHRGICIEANGHFPSQIQHLEKNERRKTWNVELLKGKDITGIVRSPKGELLANAEVVLCTAKRGCVLDNGRLRTPPNDFPLFVRTGTDGHFTFPPQNDPYLLVALDDCGFARVDEQVAMKEITLEPWARVEGTITIDGKPAARELVRIEYPHLLNRQFIESSPERQAAKRINFCFDASTDREGRFVFETRFAE